YGIPNFLARVESGDGHGRPAVFLAEGHGGYRRVATVEGFHVVDLGVDHALRGRDLLLDTGEWHLDSVLLTAHVAPGAAGADICFTDDHLRAAPAPPMPHVLGLGPNFKDRVAGGDDGPGQDDLSIGRGGDVDGGPGGVSH